MSIDPALFRGWHQLPGASSELLAHMALELGRPLPSEYLGFLRYMNGGEGFLAGTYVRLYSADQLSSLNRAYAVQQWLPGHLLIGSDGGGTAITLAPDGAIVEVPFIPMDTRYSTRRVQDWASFLGVAAGGVDRPQPIPSYIGKEIHELQPVLFGGDPCDPANKVTLSPEEHAPLVVGWNRKFREVAPEGSGQTTA
jgi:hypothetical protein